MGINQRTKSVAANNLTQQLHLLTGQIGKPGATLFPTGQPNAWRRPGCRSIVPYLCPPTIDCQ
jgi:anaerobic selenocysteine-containing dehydrogenase